MSQKNVLRKYALLSYFLIVFLISWGGSILSGGAIFLQGRPFELPELLPMGVAMLLGPSLTGIILTYAIHGAQGLRDLFVHIKKWNVSARWYAVLLVFPLLILLVLLPLSVLVTRDLSPAFFPAGILMGLSAGLIEEIGWTGFAYPEMRRKKSFLRASISLGLVHALWHMVADFMGNYPTFGANWLPYFAGFFVFVVALRVIISWVYEHTESLLLSQLIHASSSGFLAVLVPMANSGKTWPLFYAFYAPALWLVAVCMIRRNK